MAVFDTVEAAQRDPPRIGISRIKSEDLALDPGDQLRTLIRGRLILLGRRHEIGAEVLPDLQPEFLVVQLVSALLRVIEGDLTLPGSVAVAIEAVVLEEGLDPGLELRRRSLACVLLGNR